MKDGFTIGVLSLAGLKLSEAYHAISCVVSFGLVPHGNMKPMTDGPSIWKNCVVLSQQFLSVREIVNKNVGEAIEELMLVERDDIFFSAHFDPARLMLDVIDVAIVQYAEKLWS